MCKVPVGTVLLASYSSFPGSVAIPPNDGWFVQEDCIPNHQRRLQTANERMM
jgi:hypothetical protein